MQKLILEATDEEHARLNIGTRPEHRGLEFARDLLKSKLSLGCQAPFVPSSDVGIGICKIVLIVGIGAASASASS